MTEVVAKEETKTEEVAKVKVPTPTHVSQAKYMTANSEKNLGKHIEITPEQAMCFILQHGEWQKSPERVADRAAEAEAKAKADAEAKAKAFFALPEDVNAPSDSGEAA